MNETQPILNSSLKYLQAFLIVLVKLKRVPRTRVVDRVISLLNITAAVTSMLVHELNSTSNKESEKNLVHSNIYLALNKPKLYSPVFWKMRCPSRLLYSFSDQ